MKLWGTQSETYKRTTVSTLTESTSLDILSLAIMCAVSFVGSFIAASLGMGGGLLVIATMASFLPPQVLIPLHGIVQLGSNAGRAVIMRSHILKSVIPPFLIGTMIGVAIGVNLTMILSTALLQLMLGVFVFYATWGAKLNATHFGTKSFFGIGLFGALATMLVGATGALLAPFAAVSKKRQEVIATHAAMMTVQHGFKIIAFIFMGLAFSPYIPLLIGMLVCGFAGTWVGKYTLDILPEQTFRIGFKSIITFLALRLIYSGITSLFI